MTKHINCIFRLGLHPRDIKILMSMRSQYTKLRYINNHDIYNHMDFELIYVNVSNTQLFALIFFVFW